MHDEPMSFLWLGVMLERAGQVARLLDMHHHTIEREHAHDIVQVALWLSLLRACSGAEEFMKQKRSGRVSARALVSFLVFEPKFPRSLRYCLQAALSTLNTIWPGPQDDRPSRQALVNLLAWLDEQQLQTSEVHELLTHFIDETAAICRHIASEIQGPARRAVTTSSG
jgi:uncharacterized alpha-E superfamily protein